MISSANSEFCQPQAEIDFEELTIWPDQKNQIDKTEINLLLALIKKSERGKIFVIENGKTQAYYREKDQTLAEPKS
jgi:hypothetical protein